MNMSIDFLIRNHELISTFALCFSSTGLLACLFLLPRSSPLLVSRGELQDYLFYMRMIIDNPPKRANLMIEHNIDYARYLSGQEFTTKGAHSIIFTGAVFSIASLVQGVLLLMVRDYVERNVVIEAVSLTAFSVMFMFIALFPPAICRSSRRSAAKLRRAAGKAMDTYRSMFPEGLRQPGREDDGETEDGYGTAEDRKG